ncbi:putative uncharacterized protein [Sutterella sp. CAG:351]|nr:putative uncharacterized protein [Sutterella sp. CAG:351]
MARGGEAEASDEFLRVLRADRVHHTDHRDVFRLLKRGVKGHRALEPAVVVLRRPGCAARLTGVHRERRVLQNRVRREALLEGSRVNKRLEARTRLTPGLRHVVEHVEVVVEAADKSACRAVPEVGCHEAGLNLRHLAERPAAVRVAHADHRARTDPERFRSA